MHTANMLLALAVLSTAAILPACSAKIETSDAPEPIEFGTRQQDGPTIEPLPAPVQAESPLEGVWTLPCTSVSPQASLVAKAEFRKNTYESHAQLYLDAGCTVSVGEQIKKGTFSLAGEGMIDFFGVDGSIEYDAYAIEGDTLYFGTEPGETEAKRPKQLNKKLPFKRAP